MYRGHNALPHSDRGHKILIPLMCGGTCNDKGVTQK